MRRTCSLFLALGLGWCHAGTASAQSSEPTPFQRLSGLFMPRNSSFSGAIPPPAKTPQVAAAQQSVQQPVRTRTAAKAQPAVAGTYESRGVVYVEEPDASVVPAVNTVAAPLPKGPPTLPQEPARTTTAPFATVSAMPPAKNFATPLATSKTGTPATGAALTRRLTGQINQACPQARNVKLAFGNDKDLTVEMDVGAMDDCNALAGVIFAIRDLDPYRINLKFNVPQE